MWNHTERGLVGEKLLQEAPEPASESRMKMRRSAGVIGMMSRMQDT